MIVSSCCGNTSVKLFADDVKLYNIYNCEDGMLNLQQSVDKLIYWSNIWQLKVNVDKCHVLSIRNRNKSKDSRPNQNIYLLDGVPLNNVSFISDLGVTFDSNLSFKLHISTIITKAIQRVGVFFRGFNSRRLDFVRKTFITYIRPLLE
jgi:hypothetical protein